MIKHIRYLKSVKDPTIQLSIYPNYCQSVNMNKDKKSVPFRKMEPGSVISIRDPYVCMFHLLLLVEEIISIFMHTL